MKTRSKLRLFMMLGLFSVLVTIVASERPAYAQCDSKQSTDIVDGVYSKLKADKGLASQITHINVVSVPTLSTVKLMGWADSKSDWESVRDIVLSFCVKVNVNDFADHPPAKGDSMLLSGGSCQSGYKPCGDICIPEGETCNISFTKQ